jgi:hypothetical protein
MRTRSLLPLLLLPVLAALLVGCHASATATVTLKPTTSGLRSPLMVALLGEFKQLRLSAANDEQQLAADQILFLAALKADRAVPSGQAAGRMAAVSGTLAAHQRIADDVDAASTRLSDAWRLLQGSLAAQPGLSVAARSRLRAEQADAARFVTHEQSILLKARLDADQRLQAFEQAHQHP